MVVADRARVVGCATTTVLSCGEDGQRGVVRGGKWAKLSVTHNLLIP